MDTILGKEQSSKLRIVVFTDRDIDPLLKYLSHRVTFEKQGIDSKKVPWQDYKDYMVPHLSVIDAITKNVWNKYGTEIDGVMFVLNKWKNGKKKLYGLHFGKRFNGYHVLLVKGRRGFEDTAGHEIKHTMDDLIYEELKIDIAQILGVSEFDNAIVHDEKHWYDFEHEMSLIWVFMSQVIHKRRISRLSDLQQKIELLKIKLKDLLKQKADMEFTETVTSSFYRMAKRALGADASPRDLVSDEVACVESFVTLVRRDIDSSFPFVTGTWSIWDLLNAWGFTSIDPEDRKPGDIILCVTGKGTNPSAVPNGHIGIFTDNDKIASNNSADGLWVENYTYETWCTRWRDRGGYPVLIYRAPEDLESK